MCKTKRRLDFVIDDVFDGTTVENVLRDHFYISGSLIKDLKKYNDGIMLNGQHIRTIDYVRKGDIITVTIYDGISENIIPSDMDLDIVFEDDDILIVNKPYGMPTHPSKGHFHNTLANGIMAHYKKNGEQHVFRAVNRLDLDTSGLMCIAKNSYSHARLCDGMREGTLTRRYAAIVVGELNSDGVIDAPIMRESYLKRCVNEKGQRAVTHYFVKQRYEGYTLVELALETGRTHQIRVHMSYIGYPLLGDWLYGEEDHDLFDRQALHSKYISLIHPVTGERISFMSEIADDMKSFLCGLKKM